MSIKRRKSVPDPAVHVEYEPDDAHEARHPHLQGLRQDVYYFVRHNPNCTRRDVAAGLGLPNNVATARVKELIDEGFIVEPPGIRKENPSGVRAKVLHVTDRQAGGKPLDRVRIELELTIDYNGVYGVRARVVGGLPQTGNPITTMKKRITVTAPHPDTYMSSLRDEPVTTVSRHELQSGAGDIIDGTLADPDD